MKIVATQGGGRFLLDLEMEDERGTPQAAVVDIGRGKVYDPISTELIFAGGHWQAVDDSSEGAGEALALGEAQARKPAVPEATRLIKAYLAGKITLDEAADAICVLPWARSLDWRVAWMEVADCMPNGPSLEDVINQGVDAGWLEVNSALLLREAVESRFS